MFHKSLNVSQKDMNVSRKDIFVSQRHICSESVNFKRKHSDITIYIKMEEGRVEQEG